MKKTVFSLLVVLASAPVIANDQSNTTVFDLSIAELLDTSISTVSRKEEKTFSAASAVYVITSEDIRRSGATAIPDLLRLVPGMNVGRLNGTMWAVNSRGPARYLSRELQVLIDGRTVCSPLYKGVDWNRVDTLFQDIERIEVIRGPGGSLWGSNASQGIINIVTKNAAATQGGYLSALVGSGQYNNGEEGRYGFSSGNFAARIYGKRTRLVASTYPPSDEQSRQGSFVPGAVDHDGGVHEQGGFRSDYQVSSNGLVTVQGDFYQGEADNESISPFGSTRRDTTDTQGANLLARLEHSFSAESRFRFQLYYDYADREHSVLEDSNDTFDADFQHNFSLTRQQLVWGLGYRRTNNSTVHFGTDFTFALYPTDRGDNLFSAFLQDEITLLENELLLTVGTKYEHNDYTGDEWQPSVKLAYYPDKNQTLWTSISRPVGVPSRAASDAYLDLNSYAGMCSAVGGEEVEGLGCINWISESDLTANVLVSFEAGYRTRFLGAFLFDNALFYDDHKKKNYEGELIDQIWGYEGVLKYVANSWHGELSYTYHQAQGESSAALPNHTVKARSYVNLSDQVDLDCLLTFVESTSTIPSSVLMDVRLAWRPVQGMEMSLLLSNLFDDEHIEGNYDPLKANTVQQREVIARVSWNF